MAGARGPRRRAIIIGGSMSGLFSAAFLRQIGWQVDVYERSTVELVGRGAGITTHPELITALEASGAGTRDLGVDVETRVTFDRSGAVIGRRPLPQVLTSWDRLQSLLRQNVDPATYHLGSEFRHIERTTDGVRVHFADGRVETGDIVVGGDGIRSGVRADVMPDVQPIYAGYYIWRGTALEQDLSARALKEVFPYFSFFLPPQQEVIGYPIAGLNNDLRPGHRRFNFIWYRVADAAQLTQMCVDRNGRAHAFSVPPPLIRDDLIVALRAVAEATLPPALNDCLRAIPHPFFTPIYDFIAPSIVAGRAALVGDAASNPRPHMGFGVAKAGCDAMALAKALQEHDDVDAGLAAYNRERQPVGADIVRHGRKLGTHMGVNLHTEQDREMHARLQHHDAMMESIAVPNFMDEYA